MPPALRKEVEWLDPLVWAREIQQGEKSRALGEVAARDSGVKLENAHRASDGRRKAAMHVLYALATSGKIPPAYGRKFVQEQRRLALMHAGSSGGGGSSSVAEREAGPSRTVPSSSHSRAPGRDYGTSTRMSPPTSRAVASILWCARFAHFTASSRTSAFESA